MDPNANLHEQRYLVAKFRQQDEDGEVYSTNDLGRFADLAEAMDQWISGGGFLPAAWESPAAWKNRRRADAKVPEADEK
jgi:hypothetical protein